MQTEDTATTTPEPLAETSPVAANAGDANDMEPTRTSPTDSGSLSLASVERVDQPSIKRVMDVPLTVTLRFGQRQLTLRELLELNTGSLVELDQQVEEPVHLMLGERLIARGEVVIVDGNYGMRVLEVVERYAGQHGGFGRTS